MASPLRAVVGFSALYIVLSSSLISFNRYLLQPDRFPYALVLGWWHYAFCSVMSGLLFLCIPSLFPSLTDPDKRISLDKDFLFKSVLPIAVCFSAELAMSNTALKYSSIPFLQMMKECNIALIYVLSAAVSLEKFVWQSAGLLVVIFLATTVSVAGEIHFSMMGFVIQGCSQLFACVKVVMQAVLLTAAGKKLDVLTYTMVVMPLCWLCLTIALSLLFYFSLTPMQYLPPLDKVFSWSPTLALNATAAFSLNVATALLIKNSGAVIFILVSILKDICIVFVASTVLDQQVSTLQVPAFSVQVAIICVYTAAKTYPDKFEGGILPGLTWVASGMKEPDSEEDQIAPGKDYGTIKA